MSRLTEIQRDLQRGPEAEEGVRCAVVWMGRTFPASRSGKRRSKSFEVGGAVFDVALSVTIRADAVASDTGEVFSGITQPDEGDDLQVDGTAYTVANVEDFHGAATVLGLVDVNA